MWTTLQLGYVSLMATMQTDRCWSARALGCGVAGLVQADNTTSWHRFARLRPLLNTTARYWENLTVVALGPGDEAQHTFTVIDGNHRLLALLTHTALWDSPVCATEDARAAAPARFGVVCHNVSLEHTHVRVILGAGPRLFDPAWRAHTGVVTGMVCPRSRLRGVGCLDFAGDHDSDHDPVFGGEASAARAAAIEGWDPSVVEPFDGGA